MYSNRTNQTVDQFSNLSQDQQEHYYLQRFGVGSRGMEAVLNTAKSLAEGKKVTAGQMKSLLSQLPGSDPSYAAQFANAVNNAGMRREFFLEAVTRNSQWDTHDAIRTSNNWNKMQSTSEVNQLLDAKFAQTDGKMENKFKTDAKPFTESDLGSDAHRMAIRDTITGSMRYISGKRDAKSMNEAFARLTPGLLENTDSKTRALIEETFERRASPGYEPPKAGSLRGDLEIAFDHKLADTTEAAETGYITVDDSGNKIDADKEVGWE